MSARTQWFLISLVLILACGLWLSYYWNGNGYFSGAATTIIESSNQKKIEETGGEAKKSSQPRSHGFAEKEIRKNKGNGYSVY